MSHAGRPEPSRPRRFLASLPAVVHYRGVDYPCRAWDLSRSGALLRGGIPWPGEASIRFTLASPAHDIEIRLEGRVARLERAPSGEDTVLGVEFVDPAPEIRASLEALLARVIEDPLPAVLDGLPREASPEAIRAALDGVSEAHRIALAVHGDLRQRERMRHDRSPRVLDALARNPNLTPPELHALAVSPALLPGTLERLVRLARDRSDEELRHRVVIHPRLPASVARSVIATMEPAEVRRLASRTRVPASLQSAIAERTRSG